LRNQRHSLPGLAALCALLAPVPAGAADVAILKSTEVAAWRPSTEALRRVAAGHSFVEYDLRGERAEAERVLNTLKNRAVILVAMGPLAAQAARDVLPNVPMVFCMVQEPARLGLVAGPNTTGVAYTIPVKNQLAAFRLVNPRGVRVGVIYTEANVGRLVEEALKASSLVRLALVSKAVTSEREVPQALRALLTGADAADAIWIPPDPVLLSEQSQRHILAESLKAGKPVYAFTSSLVEKGALVSNGPDLVSVGELTGDLVNRLAAGERGKIEMLVPRAELVINKRMAVKLKIDIPPDVLKTAARTF
jgi:putative tryptophan/tyrosine transport system substrate-binding protein